MVPLKGITRISADIRITIQLFLKRYHIARDTFQGLLAGNPEDLAASYSLAKTLELSGKLQDAEDIYKKTAAHDELSLMGDYQLSGFI